VKHVVALTTGDGVITAEATDGIAFICSAEDVVAAAAVNSVVVDRNV
jgi:hypothetical protein